MTDSKQSQSPEIEAVSLPFAGREARVKARRRKKIRSALLSVVFCGPAVFLYGAFLVLPAIMGFGYSFTDWSGWTMTPNWVGLDNFRELFHDKRFFYTIRFTLFETALIVFFFTFVSLVLAVFLDRLRMMKGLIRGLFFYPYILSILVAALLFQYLANFREGAINSLIRASSGWLKTMCDGIVAGAWEPSWLKAGATWLAGHAGNPEIFTQDWMGSPNFVPYFIFALVAWSGMGFFTTLYLANLQTVPSDLYEAASIDGAGPLAAFFHIQIPMLIPTITTNSVLALITGINLFPQIVVTTNGGPGYRTETMAFYIYRLGFLNNRQGYASAVSFVMFVALVAVAAIQVWLLRRKAVNL